MASNKDLTGTGYETVCRSLSSMASYAGTGTITMSVAHNVYTSAAGVIVYYPYASGGNRNPNIEQPPDPGV